MNVKDNVSGSLQRVSSELTLVIFDRRLDLITPLLVPWNYQAMLHEFFTIRLNTLVEPSILIDDEFYWAHLDDSFGDVAQNISRAERETRLDDRNLDLEDGSAIQNLLNQHTNRTNMITKHLDLVHKLSTAVESHLLDVSTAQEELLANGTLAAGHHNLENFPQYERYKLLLLSCLLGNEEAANDDPDLLARKLRFLGSQIAKNTGGSSTSNTLVSNLLSKLQHRKNHESLLAKLLPSFSRGCFDDFPAVGTGITPNKNKAILIFMLGGATYTEARDIQTFATLQNQQIYLGTTFFHNSKSFLADASNTHF